jgi:CRISPR/Cas system-associated protein Csm6
MSAESNSLFKLDDEHLKERLVEGLVALYGERGVANQVVAKLCDDYLDRSGYLLGEIRRLALERKQEK